MCPDRAHVVYKNELMTRRILLIVIGMMAAWALSAQNHQVTVQLQDAQTGEAIGFATVSLTPVRGQSQAKYALSNSEGKAVVEKVRTGTYTFKAEIMGYKPDTREVEVKGNLDMGIVKLSVDQEVLDAASVSAVGNPIVIKKDTVEYNASSFKISDNDMLENLLKKLPGVEVAEDGSITANGETITKITIDGKTFFLDDPQLASKNIPAKLIEKVKVVKKKSEQAEFTGIDDGNEETIIDLSVQRNMMNGVFGNLIAGGGHDLPSEENTMNDWRYQGSLMAGRFTDKNQLSIIANSNNTNGGGFTDRAGAMMGGGMGGFGQNNGITTSWMGGVNGNADLFDDKMELGGNYMYSGSNNDVSQRSYKENYLTDGSTQIQDNESYNHRHTTGNRFGIRLEHKFSENTSLLFQPQFNFGRGHYSQVSDFTTDTDLGGVRSHTNDGFSNNTGENKSFSSSGFLLLRQRLGMPGRTLSANIDWSLSNNQTQGYNMSLTKARFDESGVPQSVQAVNQFIDQLSRSRSAGARLVYTEPLGAGFYVEGSYQYRWNQSQSSKDTYDSGDFDVTLNPFIFNPVGQALNADYSNSILNRYVNQSIGVAVMYQEDKVRAQLGFSANPTNTHNETNGIPYDSKVLNWAPRAMLFYDFTDNSNIRLFYNGRSGQPSTSQLMPVLDNSNPLSMSLGNPYLIPYFNHNARTELEYSNRQTFFTARLNLQGGYNRNPIVNAIWYDTNGRQYSFPVNGNDSYNASARIMVNTPIAKSNFSVSNMTNVSYSKSGSYIGAANLDMSGYWNADMTDFDYESFHTDYPDLNNTAAFLSNTTHNLNVTERLRATYRNDFFEFILSGQTRVSKPWYTLETSAANTTWNNQVSASSSWTVGDSGFELNTDADYNWYEGYATPMESELIWNASISKLILHNQATIALRAYDILNQSKNLRVTDTDNYHQESTNNTLGRYVILSFTWRFGSFGRGQMRGQMGGRGGGPGGPPRGGRRPSMM